MDIETIKGDKKADENGVLPNAIHHRFFNNEQPPKRYLLTATRRPRISILFMQKASKKTRHQLPPPVQCNRCSDGQECLLIPRNPRTDRRLYRKLAVFLRCMDIPYVSREKVKRYNLMAAGRRASDVDIRRAHSNQTKLSLHSPIVILSPSDRAIPCVLLRIRTCPVIVPASVRSMLKLANASSPTICICQQDVNAKHGTESTHQTSCEHTYLPTRSQNRPTSHPRA